MTNVPYFIILFMEYQRFNKQRELDQDSEEFK